ncbi:MAG: alpha/beta fold hydrolase [Nitriliruptorales bacterium]
MKRKAGQQGEGRPSWVSDRLFPFESRFMDLEGARLHYVDEGRGPVMLMLHGNTTWSFLYRHLIVRLRGRFRCVALGFPGFGLSSAAPNYGFLPAEYSHVVEAFVEALDLRATTLFVQDWGGPIGLRARLTTARAVPGPRHRQHVGVARHRERSFRVVLQARGRADGVLSDPTLQPLRQPRDPRRS